jgi:hypothetical protein
MKSFIVKASAEHVAYVPLKIFLIKHFHAQFCECSSYKNGTPYFITLKVKGLWLQKGLEAHVSRVSRHLNRTAFSGRTLNSQY